MMVSYKTALHAAQQRADAQGFEATRATWLMLDLFHWTRTDWLMRMDEEMSDAHQVQFEQAVARMLKGEPIQYITGYQSFYGLSFRVTPDTLIPRPETEEVMLHFQGQLREGAQIADIGTGTGAIAITLKTLMPSLQVIATDMYAATLAVAKANAADHHVSLTWLQGDLLQPLIERGIKLDGLISNPPYIDEADQSFMAQTVLDYEPHQALFADAQGYALYERMIQQLPAVLNDGAPVVFEIGHNQGATLKAMMQSYHPQCHVEVINDINGNPRILSFIWHG